VKWWEEDLTVRPTPAQKAARSAASPSQSDVGREAVKERPILFSAPMVRAILSGEKTQTRRVVKPTPKTGRDAFGSYMDIGQVSGDWPGDAEWIAHTACRYGKPGDLLWVREAWLDAWAQNLGATSTQYHYRADPGNEHYGYKWRPSIHMPRAVSRITLKVTDVRVQRLQDISEEDARAEGVERMKSGRGYYSIKHGHAAVHFGVYHDYAKEAFAELWDSINGEGAWNANPWVYALTFERVKP
jgi:hypothetical protein